MQNQINILIKKFISIEDTVQQTTFKRKEADEIEEDSTQVVSAFKKRFAYSKNDKKSSAEILRGGQSSSIDSAPLVHVEKYIDGRMSYIDQVKAIEYSPMSQKTFFSQQCAVYTFGMSTTFYVRMGYDNFSHSKFLIKLN